MSFGAVEIGDYAILCVKTDKPTLDRLWLDNNDVCGDDFFGLVNLCIKQDDSCLRLVHKLAICILKEDESIADSSLMKTSMLKKELCKEITK